MKNPELSTNDGLQPFSQLYDISRQFELSWKPFIESYSRIIQSSFDSVLKSYSSLADLYLDPDSLNVTKFLRPDTADGAENDKESLVSVSTQEEDKCDTAIYSTRSADVNKANQEFLDYLRTRTDEIANDILRTEFEDGMDNDITLLIKSFARSNKSATYNWLDELYSKNVNRPAVVQGVLRTLAMITEPGDENILLPMVIASLRSKNSAEQEAAIMVIEEWRTKECLDAISTITVYSSEIIADYARMVTNELKEELGQC